MTTPLSIASLVPLAYVIGSIPFGLLVGLAKGVDPRKAGSGNIGATNVGRLLGGKFFALVFTLDLLKGMIPMLITGALMNAFNAPPGATLLLVWLGVGFAAVLGHNYSLFLKFKGGKGVATSCGVALGLFPYFTLPALVSALTFMVVFKFTRYVSLGSIVAAVAFPVFYIFIGVSQGWDVVGAQWPLLAFALLICFMIVYKHRTNISRLRAGTENKFVKK